MMVVVKKDVLIKRCQEIINNINLQRTQMVENEIKKRQNKYRWFEVYDLSLEEIRKIAEEALPVSYYDRHIEGLAQNWLKIIELADGETITLTERHEFDMLTAYQNRTK